MMPDMDQLYTALRNADAAGDVDAARKLAAHIQAVRSQAAPAAAVPAGALSKMEKFGQGVMDPVAGASQLVEKAADKLGLSNAMAGATNWLSDKTDGLLPRYPAAGVDKLVRTREADYEARRKAAGETGFDGYRFAGNVASPVNLVAGAGGAGATLAARAALGAGRGAASAALMPTTGEDDFWSEKGRQAGMGAGVGAALAPVLGAAARIISPNASKNANVALLRKEGVTPTIGQTLGGNWGRTEEKLMSAPVVGDAVRTAHNRANSQFQTAAFNRALAPVGEKLPDGLAGRDAVDYTEGLLRQKYDDTLTRIGAIPADQAFVGKIANLGSMVNRDVLSADAKKKFGTILSDVQDAFDQHGMLTSEGYKRVESQLGSDFRTLGGAQDIYDNRLAPAVKQLQQELRDLLRRHSGQEADNLAAANEGWASFKRVQNAAGKLGADDGNFTPAQFQNAVRALDKSKDKGAFARGSALGQDLGDAGKTVLTGKVPNSATTDRGLLLAALVNPSLLLAPLAGAGAYNPLVQRALVAAAASRPAAAQPAAEALRKASPMLIPGLTQFSLDALK